jgi:flagellar basal-body rod modification protein FlgD
MVDISAASSTAAADYGKSAQSLSDFSKNFNSFLTLLTQQLKNQDPLKPMDATQFTTQLVQFTGVEQSIRQNQNLESLLSLQQEGQFGQAVSYIGKMIDLKGGSASLTSEGNTISYKVASAAQTVLLTITDEAGVVVREVSVDAKAGAHSYTWDGKNDSGQSVPDGIYNVSAAGVDSTGTPVAVTTTSSKVNAGRSTDIAYTLSAGAPKVMLTITNASGTVIRSVEVPKTIGPHSVTWDGRDDNNKTVPDGTYNVDVKATNADGTPARDIFGNFVQVTTASSGLVTGVSMVNGKIVLAVGSKSIPLSEVTSIRNAPTT